MVRREMGGALPAGLAGYVHVHDTLSFIALAYELSGCHAGILVSNVHVNRGDPRDTYYPHMADYFLGSKLFDYHEAGLLCLTQPMRLARHVFPGDGAIREVQSLAEVVQVVANMEVRAVEVAPGHRLGAHAHRLAEFYVRLQSARRR